MVAAPFYDDIADGPEGGAAQWLKTADGLRIRVAHWPLANAKGTVLMFPGRTEYAEKYGRTARAILAKGYEMVAVDWRGQGLADRMAEDRGLGHVGDFSDYQHDVTALVSHLRENGLPEPYYLLAHSMGGCIGLRALHNKMPVKAAAFSAPMWGIEMSPVLRIGAYISSTIATACGFGKVVSPGQTTQNYIGQTTLEDNLLTADPKMFDYMENQLKAHPDLGLGGPSLQWLKRAFTEMDALHAMESPSTPSITFLGTKEEIVVPARIKSRTDRWTIGELVIYPEARHEVLIEVPQTRDDAYNRAAALFETHR